jgi:simple sugar transport system permease protein
LAIPYGFAALGGAWAEESGVPHIALEGVMLTSAFVSVAVHLASGSAWAGVAAGAVVGAVVGALHAGAVVRARVDAIVSGVALNLAAVGGTRAALRGLFGSSANSPTVQGFAGGVFADPLLYLLLVGSVVAFWVRTRTRVGLAVRAVGEREDAAALLGLPTNRLRTGAVVVGSGIAGLGGVALAFDQHQFTAQMTAGRGFIALAAIILGRYRPERTLPACMVFALAESSQTLLQARARLPGDIASALPYVATLIILGASGRSPFHPRSPRRSSPRPKAE